MGRVDRCVQIRTFQREWLVSWLMFGSSLCWPVVWLVSLLSSFLFGNLVVSMRGWLVCSFVGWWFGLVSWFVVGWWWLVGGWWWWLVGGWLVVVVSWWFVGWLVVGYWCLVGLLVGGLVGLFVRYFVSLLVNNLIG